MTGPLVSRLGFLVALVGSLLGAAPAGAGPHCATASDAAGHHGRPTGHESHPAPPTNDTESADQCPHCPPVDCARHTECAMAADLTVPVVRAGVLPPSPALQAVMAVSHIPASFAAPPTPPPQPRS